MSTGILKSNLLSHYIKMDGEKKKYNTMMAEYIKASEKLRREIMKEHNPFIMLDKSLLCIGLMTGDMEFYKQNKERLLEMICKWDYEKLAADT